MTAFGRRLGCQGAPEPADAGETLVEVLVAVVILGLAVVALAGAFTTYILVSDVHRRQTTAAAGARDYAEQVETYAAGSGYVSCATPAAYAPATVNYTAPSGYTASVAAVQYWSGTAWTTGCTTDRGLQQVTAKVASNNGRASETVVVVVRRPCGTGSSCTS